MIKILNPIQTTWLDYPDNESLAIIVCMIGCDNCCKGCQNLELKDYNYTKNVKIYENDEFIEELRKVALKNRTNKIVLSGGDPLSCFNINATKYILEKCGSEFDFCIYSGHNIDYVKNNNIKGFKFVKCGYFNISSFRKSEKTDDYIQFASPNQTLYNENYKPISENGIYYFNKS